MVEITVSNDNFNTLIGAHPFERVCVKHKNMQGEVWLEKKYHKVPEPKKSTDKNFGIVALECKSNDELTEKAFYLMQRGYHISSTDCSEGKWRAVMVKEVNDNDKD